MSDTSIMVLVQEVIRREVERCLQQAGPRKHILNVGHGVLQKTPEQAVALFCQLARKSASTPQVHQICHVSVQRASPAKSGKGPSLSRYGLHSAVVLRACNKMVFCSLQ